MFDRAISSATGRIKDWSDIEKLSGKATSRIALSFANPNFEKGIRYQVNCQRCIAAYEMLRRGYDVEALPAPLFRNDDLPYASREGGWRNMFVNNELGTVPGSTECEVKANVESMMKSFGDGARAVVSVFWKAPQTNGHVFIAEQVDGKTIFVDPQSGNGDCGDYFMAAEVGETQILRIDDNDLTDLVFKAVRRRRA